MPIRVELGTFAPGTSLLRSHTPPVQTSIYGLDDLGACPVRAGSDMEGLGEADTPPAAQEVAPQDGGSLKRILIAAALVVGAAWLMGR